MEEIGRVSPSDIDREKDPMEIVDEEGTPHEEDQELEREFQNVEERPELKVLSDGAGIVKW